MIYTRAWAWLSDDKRFRWFLGRIWKPEAPSMHFVMLNPSTADGEQDDPTIRKCVGFADRAGCGTIFVTNLFSFRATDPADLIAEAICSSSGQAVIGSETDAYIRDSAFAADFTVAAWGGHARRPFARPRTAAVGRLLSWAASGGVYVLKTAEDGVPHHPLMLAYTCKPTLHALQGRRVA